MAAVLSFFVKYAPLIYMLLAVGLVFGIQRMVRARAERRQAIYGLEQEIAHRHTSMAISVLSLVGFLAFAEFVLVAILAPNIPALFQVATPTMNPLEAPTGTLSPELMKMLGAATPGLTSTPQVTGCIPGQVMITSPKAGDEIRGKVTLEGTANIPNFGYYKYEFSPMDLEDWATVEANHTVVQDGILGTWDTSAITPSYYQLRLVVTDNEGNALPACVVPVQIKAP
ncbi:MAG: hypothetical protein ABIF04_02980 [Chloroflexota bacterium]